MTQGLAATFKYDPFGRRIEKVFTQNSTSITTNYLYDGDNAIETVDQNGNVLAKFAQGQNIDEPLAESVGGATYDYEQDGLGSVTSLTNSSGTLSLSYTYDGFGKVTASSGSVSNPFRYTGRDFDSETGLYYYRARYYDPTTGRFLSEDPAGFQSGVDFYEYVANRPTLLTDETGLDPNGQSVWQRFKKWWHDFWYPPNTRPGFAPALYNQCNSGDTMLFTEGSPVNPYYGADTRGNTNANTDAAVNAWKSQELDKCEKAKTPGKTTDLICGGSALGPSGPVLVCSCCEHCSIGNKK